MSRSLFVAAEGAQLLEGSTSGLLSLSLRLAERTSNLACPPHSMRDVGYQRCNKFKHSYALVVELVDTPA